MCEKSGLTSSTTTTTNRINTFILPGHYIPIKNIPEDDVGKFARSISPKFHA